MSATVEGLNLKVEYPPETEVQGMRERFLEALPKLARAVEEFNRLFEYDLRLPVDVKTLESAAMIAELRGQPALAASLRSTLPKAMEVVT